MNISVISGSNRENSGSRKVSNFIHHNLQSTDCEAVLFDLAEMQLPLWSEDMWDGSSTQHAHWKQHKNQLEETDALVIVAAEWNGTIPTSLHNFMMHMGREVAHKPVLLVSVVSNSTNGAYPIVELRAFGSKNNRMLCIPDHVIVRNIGEVLDDNRLDESRNQDYLTKMRIRESLAELVLYAKHMKALRAELQFDYQEFKNGM